MFGAIIQGDVQKRPVLRSAGEQTCPRMQLSDKCFFINAGNDFPSQKIINTEAAKDMQSRNGVSRVWIFLGVGEECLKVWP